VCVNAAGRDRLPNQESWPDSVRVADWFFRDRSSQVDNEEKQRRVSLASTSPTRNNLQQARMGVEPAATAAVSGIADMDTIIASDEHDVASQQIEWIEQDSTVDQTSLYQYGEC